MPTDSNQAAPAALANFRLLLLPSDPDKIHGMTPHGTQSSSSADKSHYSMLPSGMQEISQEITFRPAVAGNAR